MNTKKGALKHIDFILLDIVCLAISFVYAFYIRHSHYKFYILSIYKEMFLVMISINLILCLFYEPYNGILKRGYLVEAKKTLIFDLLNLMICVLYMFVFKIGSEYSRISFGMTFILYCISSYVTRVLWKKHLRKKSVESLTNGSKSLLIICKAKDIDSLFKQIKRSNFDNYQISGICCVDNDNIQTLNKQYKTIGDLSKLLNYISTNWVDDILVASDYNKIPKEIIKGIIESGIPVHIMLSKITAFEGRTQTIGKIGDINVISAVRKTYSNSELVLKRCMDIVGGLVGCIFTLILIIIIGPVIYAKSPGNIIYSSDRVGKNGKVFKFYKFRSMVTNADELKKELMKRNRVKDGMMFKIENDPRIIPGIGSFIRRTSLDEFPQFFNVLKGEMSLVGTRPPTLDEWNKYSPYYRSRLSIKPGITGMWQVSGRSNITDFNEVVRLDNEYINNWSLSLDIKIIIKTITNVFIKKENGAM